VSVVCCQVEGSVPG